MTGYATRRSLGMIHALQRPPSLRHMAGLAQVAGQRVAGRLALYTHPIMATGAAGADTAMVEYSGHPGGGPVAIIADIGAGEMIDRLAGCGNTVMAAGACPAGIEMIEVVNAERPLAVTLATIKTGRQMPGRLAGRQQLVVAVHTARRGAAKDTVAVTVITDQYAVRTVEWEACRVVIELRGPACIQRNAERRRIMAGIAVFAGRHMSRRHAHCYTVIVTGATACGYVLVIVIDMTGFAFEAEMSSFSGNTGGLMIVFRLLFISHVSRLQGGYTAGERKHKHQQQGCKHGFTGLGEIVHDRSVEKFNNYNSTD